MIHIAHPFIGRNICHPKHLRHDISFYHHGILGQKWGVRRYQNKDGTLTSEGKKHYNKTAYLEDSKKELENFKGKLEDLKKKKFSDIWDKYSEYEKLEQDVAEYMDSVRTNVKFDERPYWADSNYRTLWQCQFIGEDQYLLSIEDSIDKLDYHVPHWDGRDYKLQDLDEVESWLGDDSPEYKKIVQDAEKARDDYIKDNGYSEAYQLSNEYLNLLDEIRKGGDL